jgi:hypothetical protein
MMRVMLKHLSMFAIGMRELMERTSGLALIAAPRELRYHSREKRQNTALDIIAGGTAAYA